MHPGTLSLLRQLRTRHSVSTANNKIPPEANQRAGSQKVARAYFRRQLLAKAAIVGVASRINRCALGRPTEPLEPVDRHICRPQMGTLPIELCARCTLDLRAVF